MFVIKLTLTLPPEHYQFSPASPYVIVFSFPIYHQQKYYRHKISPILRNCLGDECSERGRKDESCMHTSPFSPVFRQVPIRKLGAVYFILIFCLLSTTFTFHVFLLVSNFQESGKRQKRFKRSHQQRVVFRSHLQVEKIYI